MNKILLDDRLQKKNKERTAFSCLYIDNWIISHNSNENRRKLEKILTKKISFEEKKKIKREIIKIDNEIVNEAKRLKQITEKKTTIYMITCNSFRSTIRTALFACSKSRLLRWLIYAIHNGIHFTQFYRQTCQLMNVRGKKNCRNRSRTKKKLTLCYFMCAKSAKLIKKKTGKIFSLFIYHKISVYKLKRGRI